MEIKITSDQEVELNLKLDELKNRRNELRKLGEGLAKPNGIKEFPELDVATQDLLRLYNKSINEIECILSNGSTIKRVSSNSIVIGSKVRLFVKYLDGESLDIVTTVVGKNFSKDPDDYSQTGCESAIGKAIMGKREDENFDVTVNGKLIASGMILENITKRKDKLRTKNMEMVMTKTR